MYTQTHMHRGFTYLNTWALFIQHRQIKDCKLERIVKILSFILIKVERLFVDARAPS